MADSEGWSLTESDPGVFTGLLKEVGVKGLEVEELYDLDQLTELHPVRALIFLFKWIGHGDASTSAGTLEEPSVPHYFARQVITNACASIALLNATMNITDPDVVLDSDLQNLKDFSDGLDPESKGWTFTNSEKIRAAHNSFARSDPYSLEERRDDGEKEDAYHFIAYLPIGNKVYELDGLKPLPISHGVFEGDWTELAKQVVTSRIATHPPGEVHFNLMAITSRSTYLSKQIASLEAELEGKKAKGETTEWTEHQLAETRGLSARIKAQLADWDIENSLRRHNYIGFIHALTLELAKQGKLLPQIEQAKETLKKRVEDKKAAGKTSEEAMDED